MECPSAPSDSPSRHPLDVFQTLPDELIIRVLQQFTAEPDPVLAFAQTSRRHNQVASDDAIWVPIIAYVFHEFHGPARSVDAADLRRTRQRLIGDAGDAHSSPFRRLYVDLIGPYRWLLGNWVVANNPVGASLWTVYLQPLADGDDDDIGFCQIVGQWAIFEPKITHTGSSFSSISDTEYNVDNIEVDVVGEKPITITGNVEYSEKERTLDDFSDNFVIGNNGHPKHSRISLFRPHQTRQSPWRDVHSVSFKGRHLSSEFDDAPFPSPSALPAIRDITYDSESRLPIISSAIYDSSEDDWPPIFIFTPLQSPSFFPDHTTNLLAEGIFRNINGSDLRIVYVRIRELTEEDFQLQSDWPWEGSMRVAPQRWDPGTGPPDWSDPNVHLGPFSSIGCIIPSIFPLRVSPQHVRPGTRIVEVTKLCGPGIPKGYRSVLAFLDDPLVPQEDLTCALDSLPQSFRDSDASGAPWPISPTLNPDLASTIDNLFQPPFQPVRGIDLPAVGRICHTTFMKPSWMDVLVHVESRNRFSVFWQDLDVVEIYTKMGNT